MKYKNAGPKFRIKTLASVEVEACTSVHLMKEELVVSAAKSITASALCEEKKA